MTFSSQKKAILLGAGIFSAGLISITAFAGNTDGNIAFPADYRSWTHTKSIVTTDKEHPLYGFRNIYVNDTGIEAIRNGTVYPDGSLIVMSFHKPVEKDGAIVEGKLFKYVLMLKDSKLTASDGWAYEAYKAGDMKPLIGGKMVEKCHNCHTSKRESDFVFSKYVK